jgi:signal peptidase I
MTKLRRWIVRLLMVLVVTIPLAGICLYLINPFGARSYDPRQRIIGYAPYRIPARDMLPSLHPDQVVVVRAGHYRRHKPERGDIVIFINREDGNPWIKRVVGLPGEKISISDGAVLVDDRKLAEDYVLRRNVTGAYSREMPMLEVQENSYFLLSDNRDNSMDSRMLGTIQRDDLSGKVVAILK